MEDEIEMWAKLFQSNGFQLLVTKDMDDDDNPMLSLTIRIDGSSISIGPCFSGDDASINLDKTFSSYDQDKADEFTKLFIDCKSVMDAMKVLTGK